MNRQDVRELHGVTRIAREAFARLELAIGTSDQSDRGPIVCRGQHDNMLDVAGEGHHAGTTADAPGPVQNEMIFRPHRRHRYRPTRGGQTRTVQQPPGQKRLRQGHCQCRAARFTDDTKAIGQRRPCPAGGLGDPCEVEANLLKRRPERHLPGIVALLHDGLRIGQIRKNTRGCFDDEGFGS